MTKAYLVWELEIHDDAVYAQYRAIGGPLMQAAGGRSVAGGGRRETLAGPDEPMGLYIVEFPSYEAAIGWYRSPEYQAAAAIRDAGSTSKVYLLEAG